jgi:hypothetical protein
MLTIMAAFFSLILRGKTAEVIYLISIMPLKNIFIIAEQETYLHYPLIICVLGSHLMVS